MTTDKSLIPYALEVGSNTLCAPALVLVEPPFFNMGLFALEPRFCPGPSVNFVRFAAPQPRRRRAARPAQLYIVTLKKDPPFKCQKCRSFAASATRLLRVLRGY